MRERKQIICFVLRERGCINDLVTDEGAARKMRTNKELIIPTPTLTSIMAISLLYIVNLSFLFSKF